MGDLWRDLCPHHLNKVRIFSYLRYCQIASLQELIVIVMLCSSFDFEGTRSYLCKISIRQKHVLANDSRTNVSVSNVSCSFLSSFCFFIPALLHWVLAAKYNLFLWKTNHHFDSFYEFTKFILIKSSTKALICERSFHFINQEILHLLCFFFIRLITFHCCCEF